MGVSKNGSAKVRAISISKYRLCIVKIENHHDLLVRRNEQKLDTFTRCAPKRTYRLPSQGIVLFL